MPTLRAVACGLALLLTAAAPAQQLGTIRFDNWLYFQSNTDGSERWQYRPRFYIPFSLSGGWTFTQRIDLPVCPCLADHDQTKLKFLVQDGESFS